MTDSGISLPTQPRGNSVSWRLLWQVVTPYWAFMYLSRLFAFSLATALDARIIIAPPHLRALQHLLLLPILVVFLRYAVSIGWPRTQRLRALLLHAGMACLFAFLARPILVGLVAAYQDNRNLLDELFRSMIGPNLSLALWIATIGDFLLTYLGALALVLGVRHHGLLRAQLQRATLLEGEWIKGRLNALQLRGNPQFVLNVLRDATGAVADRPRIAQEMLQHLSRVLQRNVSIDGEEMVPINQEIEAARDYIEIQKLRFGGRIRAEFTVDDTARDALVPALVLQPLLEDVLVRSQNNSADALQLRTQVRRVPQGIEISVQGNPCTGDTGAPAPSAALELLRERLHTLFGSRHGASVETEASQDVGVRMRVPLRMAGAHG